MLTQTHSTHIHMLTQTHMLTHMLTYMFTHTQTHITQINMLHTHTA